MLTGRAEQRPEVSSRKMFLKTCKFFKLNFLKNNLLWVVYLYVHHSLYKSQRCTVLCGGWQCSYQVEKVFKLLDNFAKLFLLPTIGFLLNEQNLKTVQNSKLCKVQNYITLHNYSNNMYGITPPDVKSKG